MAKTKIRIQSPLMGKTRFFSKNYVLTGREHRAHDGVSKGQNACPRGYLLVTQGPLSGESEDSRGIYLYT